MVEFELQSLKDENERLTREIARLTSEVELLKSALRSEELVDLWGHQAYRIGLQRLTRFGVVIVTIVGVLGAGFFFDVYRKVNEYVTGEAQTVIHEQIETMSIEVGERAEKLITDIDAKFAKTSKEVDDRTTKLLEDANKEVDDATEKLNARVEEIYRKFQDTDKEAEKALDDINDTVADTKRLLEIVQLSAERARQLALVEAAPGEVEEGFGGGSEKEDCGDDARRVDLIAVDQAVVDSGSRTDSGQVLFRNTFSVSVGMGQELEVRIRRCTLNRIDRVVYNLSERWFSPSEIVKVNPLHAFSFSIRVWGRTPIRVRVYMKDEAYPIEFEGYVHASPAESALDRVG